MSYGKAWKEVLHLKLLVIEDDVKLNQMLCEILKRENYTVKVCADGDEGAYYLNQNEFDLALVDWMLPGKTGLEILRECRNKGIMTPVVMLTALTAVENKVACLDAGADDYLGKPFDSRELLARVRANLRRRTPIETRMEVSYGDLRYDAGGLRLSCGTRTIAVSRKLGAVTEILMRGEGRPVSRTTLFARVWGTDADVEEAILENYIGFLRRKLVQLHSQTILQTVRGVGYVLLEKQENK